MLFAVQGAHRKKFVTAGCAAQRLESQKASGEGSHSGDALRGDALQFQIAADSTMRVHERAKRQQTRIKSRRASFAAPGKDSRESKEIVRHRAAFGAPGIRAVTNRTACQADSDLFSPGRA